MSGLHEYLYGIRPSDVLVLDTNQEQNCIQVFRVCVNRTHAECYDLYL
jgi:hypothetical protein